MTRNVPIGSVVVARDFWKRFFGFMGSTAVDVRMLFPRCASVHTFFMRVPIDVVFLDEAAVVVKIAAGVRPWRFVSGGSQAAAVLEASAGFASANGLTVGDRIEWQ